MANLNSPLILGRMMIRPYPCGIAGKIEKSDGGFRPILKKQVASQGKAVKEKQFAAR